MQEDNQSNSASSSPTKPKAESPNTKKPLETPKKNEESKEDKKMGEADGKPNLWVKPNQIAIQVQFLL